MSVEQDAAAVVAVPAHHDEMENGLDLSTPKKGDGLDGLDELGQLSPSSRRRSTRASAIKAQEKIKIGDIPLVRPPSAQEMEEEEEEEEEEGGMKRRKLADGSAMDQFSHRFGLQVKDDEVYVLSDGSEVSSLHDSEISVLKKNYEKLVAAEPSEEQKAERLAMIRRAESELRGEEARLAMLKKMRSSQTQGAIKVAEASRKLASSVPQNGAGAAYKPAVASTPNKPGAKPAAASNPMLAFAGLTVKQQQEFLQRAAMNPTSAAMAAQALLAASKSGGGNSAQAAALAQMFAQAQAQAQAAQNKASASTTSNNKPSGTSTPTPSAAVSAAQLQAKQLAAQTPQQRAAAARQAFRRQADQQLMTIPAPKAPPTDLFFISNPAQPDFCALVGLDLCVQKVLKDKTVNAAVNEGPYECEECGTDFTPSWRAIGADETDLHLYCEQCVRAAQKKKIRHDHQALLKKAYARIGTQEKEFEKQIADGKLDAALAAAAASASTSGGGSQQTQPQNLSTRPSGTSTPLQKPSTPLPSTSTPKPATPTAAPQAAKRPATSTANAMQMQAQLAALAQMARSNPMMAAMMSNMGQMQMQQLQQLLAAGGGGMAQMGGWNPMAAAQAAAAAQAQAQAQREKEQKEKEAREQREREAREARERQQHQQQQAAAAAAASMGGGMNMAAMNLLMAAAQSQAQGSAAAQIQAAFGGINPAALLQNPQLLRQMQLQMAQLTSRKK